MPDSMLKRGIQALEPAARVRAMTMLKRNDLPSHELDHLFVAPDGGALGISCGHLPTRPAEVPVAAATGASPAAVSVPVAQVPAYSSRPGSRNVLLIDFNGHVVTDTAWNSPSVLRFTARPFSLDGDYSTFNEAEQAVIREVWQRVAEDYAPFDINVTTVEPAICTATTIRVLVTPELDQNGLPTPAAGSGGMAFVGAFGGFDYSLPNGNTAYGPAWVNATTMYGYGRYIADAVSHEAGHNLQLHHDGVTGGSAYYTGHVGTSALTRWAPIMGVGYYATIVQWSKGEYLNANNQEDDLRIIADQLMYRPDDHGSTGATATLIDSSTGTLSAHGVIERADDVDGIAFVAGSGPAVLTVQPWSSGNLDVRLTLRDAAGGTVATTAPTGDPSATITAMLIAGRYHLAIAADGEPTVPATGYTTYGSIGQWFLTGTVTAPGTTINHAPVATSTAVTTTQDMAVTIILAATDADGDLLTYGIVGGPLHGTLSGGTGSTRTYTPVAGYAGTDAFTFKAKDATAYSGGATVSITVTATTPGGPAGYVWCAHEGGTVLLNGICDVAYGANGTYAFRQGVSGSITFNNSTFGDPLPWVGKEGYFRTQTVITAQPQAVTIASGATATLTVTATGPSLVYQWYQGASGITTTPMPGATSPSFTTPALTASTSYWVRVGNGTGNLNSATATVTVTGTGTGGPAGYVWCAREGGSFRLSGVCDVAYGANGRFAYNYAVTGLIVFNNTTFGGDPIYGAVKAGYYRTAATAPTDPVSLADAAPAPEAAEGDRACGLGSGIAGILAGLFLAFMALIRLRRL